MRYINLRFTLTLTLTFGAAFSSLAFSVLSAAHSHCCNFLIDLKFIAFEVKGQVF